MQRRTTFFVPFLLAGCKSPKPGFEEILPAEVAGGWKRGELIKPGSLPPVVAELAPEDAAEAIYTGPGTIRARAYRMKAETSAFELMQKWRQADGMAAYRGPYFFTARADGVDPGVVMAFLGELKRSPGQTG